MILRVLLYQSPLKNIPQVIKMLTQRNWLSLVPSLSIYVIKWINDIFVLNRFQGCAFTHAQRFALYFYLMSGFVTWLSGLSIQFDTMVFQVTSALLSTAIEWLGFVILYNEGLRVTKQQVNAFIFSCFITILYEIKNRLDFNE